MEFVFILQSIIKSVINSDGIRNWFAIIYQFHIKIVIYLQ